MDVITSFNRYSQRLIRDLRQGGEVNIYRRQITSSAPRPESALGSTGLSMLDCRVVEMLSTSSLPKAVQI